MIPADLVLADPAHLEPHAALTRGGIGIARTAEPCAVASALAPVVEALDHRRGLLLACGVDAPGRYRRGAIGFVDPPLAITTHGRGVRVEALNGRGRMLLPAMAGALAALPEVAAVEEAPGRLGVLVRRGDPGFTEEERSRQPTVFSVLRGLRDLFAAPGDPLLGLYGAFGYDLAFQFEPVRRRLDRPAGQRDLVLYLPDRLVVVDPGAGVARRFDYDFTASGASTAGLPRDGAAHPYRTTAGRAGGADHAPGAYAAVVERARAAFRRGDLFEAVPGQTFSEPCGAAPSAVFGRLTRANPAPYEALVNLGQGEFLVAASPEMYVRVAGTRVETCPISGTIARGADALGDARQVLALLNSAKDAAELTMCTDVDRNDKARVCEAGSVRVVGRRMIELYSRLIHTVDHVEGRLRPGCDALDAFLTHAWAVTVTGAPKRAAMQFLEDTEASARRWYGGAFGRIGFDGGLDTGLTLRTIRLQDGLAHVRVGATLLADSDPQAEDAECRLKAAALFDAIRGPRAAPAGRRAAIPVAAVGQGRRVLLVDHEDSFVHSLGDLLRQTGCAVTTVRHAGARAAIAAAPPDLVVLSPGPGRPADFAVAATLDAALALGVPVFGVCLGLQGIAERFGGALGVLAEPVHGKASEVRVLGGRLLAGLPPRLRVGRYHSLHALRATLPPVLEVTAETEDGVVMALEHRTLPVAAVQFHPESILTQEGGAGLRLVGAAVAGLTAARRPVAA